MLASTKDRDHRIYLSRGIFAENTLFYASGAWQNRPWTYPNYQRADYHQFLDRCREYYRVRNENGVTIRNSEHANRVHGVARRANLQHRTVGMSLVATGHDFRAMKSPT